MIEAKVLSEMARKGAKYGSCGRMCKECAFKEGATANKEEKNVLAAHDLLLKVAIYGDSAGQFNCHQRGTFKDKGELCKGFLYAKQYLNNSVK